MAPLYHGTSVGYAADILSGGGLKALTGQRAYKLMQPEGSNIRKKYKTPYSGQKSTAELSGISLTRNPRFAKTWSEEIVFEFDQAKLSQKYKIIPMQFWSLAGARYNSSHGQDHVNEYEEFLLLKQNDILPLKYVTNILVSKKVEDKFLKAMQKTGVYLPYDTF